MDRWAGYFENLLNRPDPLLKDSDLFDPDNIDDDLRLIDDRAPTVYEIETAIKALKKKKNAQE